ncbi:HNH endonuclease [Listeria booriae]|uniref:HNH endonuclease n=1 Tax=Listeria booriae TaxID=1552123 RepID=UPI00162957B6|nr:HNH endonuclease [Listeria booriae]MBC2164946.1 hypothetical protein [Listeria booriae]
MSIEKLIINGLNDSIRFEEGEQWRFCRENSYYLVSSHGRVFSLRLRDILKPFLKVYPNNPTTPNRYERVGLYLNGERKNFYVHRLVASAFLGLPIRSRRHCHHRDGNKRRNHVQNLEILTSKQHKKLHREMHVGDDACIASITA